MHNWFDDYKKHAIESYPNECVGIVTKDGQYVRLKNHAIDPSNSFAINPYDLAQYDVDTVCHSHPTGIRDNIPIQWPSQHDMETFVKYPQYKWMIIGTDGVSVTDTTVYDSNNTTPLLGRSYIHGINDCYSIIRDWYRSKGITIKDYPRSYLWWQSGQDLYSDNFADCGFEEIYPGSIHDLMPGDVLMTTAGGSVIAHAYIYVGDGLVYHHLANHISCSAPVQKVFGRAIKYVRYRGNHE